MKGRGKKEARRGKSEEGMNHKGTEDEG